MRLAAFNGLGRLILAGNLCATILLAGACADRAPDIPEAWKDIVVSDQLSKIFEINGDFRTGKPPGVTAFYTGITVEKVRADYRARIEKSGYELLLSCKDDGLSDVFVNSSKSSVEFWGRHVTETLVDVLLRRGGQPMSSLKPRGKDCKWSSLAKQVCKSWDHDKCYFNSQ